jgi:hypothetical protein
MRTPIAALLALLCLASTASAAPFTVFKDNYESPVFVAGGVLAVYSGAGSVQSTASFASIGLPFSGTSMWVNSDSNVPEQTHTTLTLTGLGSHTSVNLSFLLAIIDSWDGDNGSGPDVFNVTVDGVSVFSELFANYGGGQTFGPVYGNDANYGYGHWRDSAYDLTPALLNIAHTSSALQIDFFASGVGWQSDEFWGIDNLDISIDGAVPEPASLLLVAAPLAGLALRRRFRRAR